MLPHTCLGSGICHENTDLDKHLQTHTHSHTHTHTQMRTDTHGHAQIHMDTHRYTPMRTDTHGHAQITQMRTDTHGHAQIHTDAHRHSQAHTHTHLHLRTIPFSLQLQIFVAHRAHTAASICGDAHAMRIEAVPQPLMPRGRFDFETLEFNAQMCRNQSGLEANEQWLEVEMNLFALYLPRRGCRKTDSILPF